MLLLWALCVCLALLCAQASGPQMYVVYNSSAQHFSSVLDSLQCYNDYSTHILCSWTESALTHTLAPLSLYHLDLDEDRESHCHPYRLPIPLPEGQLTVRCQHNTLVFGIGIEDAFFFKTPHSPRLSKTLFLSQHVRVRPPHSLEHKATKGGGIVLNWQSSYPPSSHLYPTLNYQVNYRRLGQDWTVIEVLGRELVIEAGSLVPGCWYNARVRSRGGNGLWSEWSPLVEWKTEEAVVPGPLDLQCVFDGDAEVTCSWEVKRDLAQLVTYSLSYRANHDAPAQWCRVDPPVSAESSHPLLRFSCSFSVSDPEKLLVELIPKYNVKVFETHKHIRPNRPSHVQVNELQENWELSWTPPEYYILPVSFQVQYWRREAPEDVKCVNLSEEQRSYRFPVGSLHPSTGYAASVRTVLTSSGGWYSGVPSDWTEPVDWTTQPAPVSLHTLLWVVVGVCTAVLLVLLLLLTLPGCRRRVKVWEMSIPSPLRSKAVEEVIKNPPKNYVTSHKDIDKMAIHDIEVVDSDVSAQHSPVSSEYSDPLTWVTTSDDSQGWESDPGPARLCGERQTKDTSCVRFRDSRTLCPTCWRPLSRVADSQSGAENRPFDSFSPTSRQTLLCENDYIDAPSAETRPRQHLPPGRLQGELVVQEGYIDSSITLLKLPEPGVEPPSVSEPLKSDTDTSSTLDIFSILIQQHPDSCFLPGLRMAGCEAEDPAQEEETCLGDMADDHTYVKLAHT